MTTPPIVDRNLALEMVRVTEAAALAASRFLGSGDEQAVDRAAAMAMENCLGQLPVNGRLVIGEGPAQTAEQLGDGTLVGDPEDLTVDIGLHPVEGATIVARGGENAIAVAAVCESGSMLDLPPLYMEKIATGPAAANIALDLDRPVAENLALIAQARDMETGDLVVCILDRPRHGRLIGDVRAAGARVRLIRDGDVSAVVATTEAESGIDVYMGMGGAREGVLAAAALRCTGGAMLGRLVCRNRDEEDLARQSGIDDLGRIYGIDDMVGQDIMFAATGITDGTLLDGVRHTARGATTHSLSMRSRSGTLRYVRARHDFSRKPNWE